MERSNKKKRCSIFLLISLTLVVIFFFSSYEYSSYFANINNGKTAKSFSDENNKNKPATTASDESTTSGAEKNAKLAFSGATSNGADTLWINLLQEGSKLMKEQGTVSVAMEVGMHRATQSIQAAKMGFQVHGVEPSPPSFKIIESQVANLDKDIKDRITLHNVAASGAPGVVEFNAGGGTGDSIGGGGANMWTMTWDKSATANQNSNTVQVQSMRLDDLISKNISPDTDVWIAKIDVQGFEPFVFDGLSNSIKNGKIRYILFEYWPKGMDFMQEVPFDSPDICKAGAKILADLASAGYQLYALGDVVHPHSYSHGQTKQKDLSQFPAESRHDKLKNYRSKKPLDDLNDFCLWYYQLDKIFPQEDYKMGFWTDVLAVAPNAQLNKAFITR